MLKKLLENFGENYSKKLGINLEDLKKEEVFKWFFASLLFGTPIQETCVFKTYRCFEKYKMIDPKKIANARWNRLVHILDEGAFVRYDFKTADKLLEIMKNLKEKYDGNLNKLCATSKNQEELEEKIKGLGKGIGEITLSIFLRDMQNYWNVQSKPTQLETLAAKNLGIKNLREYWKKNKIKGYRFSNFETALLRLGKNFCRKKKCSECIMREFCKKKS